MSQSLNVMKQPKPFYLIFFIELWERFGYYGLQAILALYFVKELGMDDAQSFVTFGAFSAMVYGLVAIGGYIGDKVLGTKRTMTLGAIVLATGYVLMAAAGHNITVVYLALASIAVGNGLFKANPSSLLGKCYEEGDARLDGAFTMYYMSVNIGSFISMILVPIISDHYGWGLSFMTSAVGLFMALGVYALMRKLVDGYGSEPDFKPVNKSALGIVLVGVVVAIAAAAWLLKHLIAAKLLLGVVGVGVIAVLLKEIFASRGAERSKMTVALILMVEAIVFFVMYMQMPTSLNFFAIKNVDHRILGMAVNPVTFQSLNPFWIMLASPILAYIYNAAGQKKGSGMTMPVKFALGMLFTAASFLILPVAAKFANDAGIVSAYWIVITYFFQSIGELLISGLGLAMIAQLLPARLHGFAMGAWFLTTSAASVIAGYVAGFASVSTGDAATPLQTLPVYSHFFETMGLISLAVGLLMVVTAPVLNRMINAKDTGEEAALATV